MLAVECDPLSLRALEARLRMQLRTAGVSATTGGATRRPGEHLTETWKRADAAMYRNQRRRGAPRGTSGSA